MSSSRDRTVYSDRWSCPICLRTVAFSSFKRHVNAHERRGIPTHAVDAAWVEFIEITGWPRNKRAANRSEAEHAA